MQRRFGLYGAILVITLVGILVLTAILIPQQTPAFDTAVKFVIAAGTGDETTAFDLLSAEMQAYVQENCPAGHVSDCVQGFTPPEWGKFLNAVYRRSRPTGKEWDVLLMATYERGQGFSGVCIYTHTGQSESGEWEVQAWAGFISCDEPNAGLAELAERDDAPNRAP